MSVSNNVAEIKREWNATFDRLDADVRKVFDQSANLILSEAQDGADKHTINGALRDAVTINSKDDVWQIGVDTNAAPHAIFVHFPTRPHLIKPKNRKSLRWGGNGMFHFAKTVKHPGYKGDPFFYDAIDKGFAFLNEQAQKLKLR